VLILAILFCVEIIWIGWLEYRHIEEDAEEKHRKYRKLLTSQFSHDDGRMSKEMIKKL